MGFNMFNIVFFICLLKTVQSASILALFSSLSFSDHLVFRNYVSLLVQSGHSLVIMTPYPGHFRHPDVDNIIELDVGKESSSFWTEYKNLMNNNDDHYPKLKAINELSLKLAIEQLKSKQMSALLLNPNINFDLVITEADVPLLYAVAEKYKAPHIAITATSGKLHQYEAKANPTHPTFYPDVNTLKLGNLSVWQKIIEFNRHLQTKNEYYNNYLPLCEVAAKKILGLKKGLQQVEYDIDLLLIAANPTLTGNRPYVPGVAYVDRMHIKPGLSLPQNLKVILDKATKGVIYFSLGAIHESDTLPPQILQTLADAFRELPYTVLWKIKETSLVKKPDNVITQEWFPQQEILAHPNTKLFITHGGARSLEEAIFYEVPILGFPLIRTRKIFIEEITKHGAGEILDPSDINKEAVKSAVSAVGSSDKYKKAIAVLKSATQDPVISGPEHAIWWTEYVIRNGGARHLRSGAVGATFYQYYMWDIIAIYLTIPLFLLWLSYISIKNVVKRIRTRLFGNPVSGKFKIL